MSPADNLSLHLLGRPRAEVDGRKAPVRGRKAWALLGYLVRSERSVGRAELSSLLFGDADDPLGAVRWNLAELRRALGLTDAFRTDPVVFEAPPGTFIDVHALVRGTWREAVSLPQLGSDLLAGVEAPGSPAFEAWLLAERRFLAARAEAALREGAQAALGAGDADAAVRLATKLVSLNPLEEATQELLIRSFSARGDRDAAHRQLRTCISLFQRELGVEPSPSMHLAASAVPVAARRSAPSARAELEAGQAALAAGATDAAIETLRGAARAADAGADRATQAAAFLALGGALVHSIRGFDEEGAAWLHRAVTVATEIGDSSVAAAATAELAYIDFLRGDHHGAQALVEVALEHAGNDEARRAEALMVLGASLTEVGRYADSMITLQNSLKAAHSAGDVKRAAFTISWMARTGILRADLDDAAALARESVELAKLEKWTGFLPWPEAFLAEAQLLLGDTPGAVTTLDHAYALACHLRDPCWEGMTMRCLALVAAARGESDEAVALLRDATQRTLSVPDAYRWAHLYCLDALCEVSGPLEHPEFSRWISDLESIASRLGMREFVVRSYLHRARLGDSAAAGAASALAAGIDNPHLDAQVAAAGEPG